MEEVPSDIRQERIEQQIAALEKKIALGRSPRMDSLRTQLGMQRAALDKLQKPVFRPPEWRATFVDR